MQNWAHSAVADIIRQDQTSVGRTYGHGSRRIAHGGDRLITRIGAYDQGTKSTADFLEFMNSDGLKQWWLLDQIYSHFTQPLQHGQGVSAPLRSVWALMNLFIKKNRW